jgi:hypothetical protein
MIALRAMRYAAVVIASAGLLYGCSSNGSTSDVTPSGAQTALRGFTAGLGRVLTTKNGGQVFGFAIDQSGKDGILATATDIETFNASSGRILASFPPAPPPGTTYSLDGIFTGGVALVTRYVVPEGSIYATRHYDLIDPFTANHFTGKWKPPLRDINVEQAGPNQSATTTALFAIELKHQDIPVLIVSNVQKNTFGKVIALDSSSYALGDQPQLAQDTVTHQAVLATSPDGGRVGGEGPINLLIDLRTGAKKQFNGLNNGPFGAGFVNGLAVDSTTGIAATTTELNAQVEFYDLATETGTAVQLPCTGSASQDNSGAGIAADPVNGLFLVTDPVYCNGTAGSAIVVYDEKGTLVETITGFTFGPGQSPPVINPKARMGWVSASSPDQLQQFFY